MRDIILKGWAFVPYEVLGDVAAERERLTFKPKYAEPDDEPMYLYSDFPEYEYLGVPRSYAEHRFAGCGFDDRTSLGEPMRGHYTLPDPYHPSVQEPDRQARFMADMEQAAHTHRSFIAEAPTGTGKTVVALNTAVKLQQKTLVLVHMERLMDQWLDELRNILGARDDQIGYIGGGQADWQDKDFVIGMLHSNVLHSYGRQFYRAFGLVIFDEVHKVGAPFFSRAVPRFPAHYRIGLSATPHRKDGGERVFLWHLGPVRVRSEAEALPMEVHVVPYRCDNPKRKLWGNNHGARMKALSLDKRRNRILAKIVRRFWQLGRNAIIVSFSVRHLQTLMDEAERLGVPRSVMGQYTRSRQVNGRNVPIKNAELDRVKEQSQLIFTNYQMMGVGIDIPRLDAGLDATPQSSAEQLIGRIRRPLEGKPKPFWTTIKDVSCPVCRKYYDNRVKDYRRSGNVEIIEHDEIRAAARAASSSNRTEAANHDDQERTHAGAEASVVGAGAQRAPAAGVPERSRVPSAGGGDRPGELPSAPRGRAAGCAQQPRSAASARRRT